MNKIDREIFKATLEDRLSYRFSASNEPIYRIKLDDRYIKICNRAGYKTAWTKYQYAKQALLRIVWSMCHHLDQFFPDHINRISEFDDKAKAVRDWLLQEKIFEIVETE